MIPMVSRPRWRSARSGASTEVLCSGLGSDGTKSRVAIIAIAISVATPKNGPRQLMAPSSPPSSGPTAMPRPSAVSYRMIAPAKPPLADATMTARLVAMNRALPSPQPARKPTIPPTVSVVPASAAKTTMRASPTTSVRVRADPAGHPADEQHGHRGDHQIAGEQQGHLTRCGVQVLRQRGQDRVHQADAHEGDDTGEGHGPDGPRLTERIRRRLGSCTHSCIMQLSRPGRESLTSRPRTARVPGAPNLGVSTRHSGRQPRGSRNGQLGLSPAQPEGPYVFTSRSLAAGQSATWPS